MSESVRLVIWDMDETFWKGTLAEEGIAEGSHAAHIVTALTKRGIMNSICSKNDFDVVREKLEEIGVWDDFLFPSINWSSKGARVADIIRKMRLRPETVMFIDDNPTNREEVHQACPGIQIEDETFVEQILESPLFVGKNDPEKTRLKQYKIEEEKEADREEAEDGELNDYDFLRKSNIQVELIYDVSEYKDRIIELLNRTNQLNFTKKRLSENKEEALHQLNEMIDNTGPYNHAGVVHVKDNYGDYGIVGFFHLVQNATHNFLVHFCFSCRTLGMHIETWLYRYFNKPELDVQGDVANNPVTDTAPVDWIKLVCFGEDESWDEDDVADYPIIMGGGCDIDSVRHYIKGCSTDISVFTNTVRDDFLIRRDHSSMVRIGMDEREREKTILKQCGYRDEDFFPPFVRADQQDWGLVVFSFWADAQFQIYGLPDSDQTSPYCPPQVGYGNFQHFYENDFLRMGGTEEHVPQFRFAKANLRPLELIDEERHKANLRFILGKVPSHYDIILFTMPSRVPDLWPGTGTVERTQTLAKWQHEVAEHFPNVHCVNFDLFIHADEEAQTHDHFTRVVYLRAGEYVRKFYREKVQALKEQPASQNGEGERIWFMDIFGQLISHSPNGGGHLIRVPFPDLLPLGFVCLSYPLKRSYVSSWWDFQGNKLEDVPELVLEPENDGTVTLRKKETNEYVSIDVRTTSVFYVDGKASWKYLLPLTYDMMQGIALLMIRGMAEIEFAGTGEKIEEPLKFPEPGGGDFHMGWLGNKRVDIKKSQYLLGELGQLDLGETGTVSLPLFDSTETCEVNVTRLKPCMEEG